MFQYSPILGRSSIWDLNYTFSPFCIKYWEKQNLIINYDWSSTFSFKIKNRITNKIDHFQYNLMYNLVFCKKNLHKWKISDSDKCNICNCIDDYDHFFVKCKYNKTFWTRFLKYIQEFTKDFNFQISLEKIISGWNIDNSNFTFVNILIELASFSVYKYRIIYYDTKNQHQFQFCSFLEIKKIEEIITMSKKILRVKVNKQDLDNCKVFWNII